MDLDFQCSGECVQSTAFCCWWLASHPSRAMMSWLQLLPYIELDFMRPSPLNKRRSKRDAGKGTGKKITIFYDMSRQFPTGRPPGPKPSSTESSTTGSSSLSDKELPFPLRSGPLAPSYGVPYPAHCCVQHGKHMLNVPLESARPT